MRGLGPTGENLRGELRQFRQNVGSLGCASSTITSLALVLGANGLGTQATLIRIRTLRTIDDECLERRGARL
jgi:hypothetical protein